MISRVMLSESRKRACLLDGLTGRNASLVLGLLPLLCDLVPHCQLSMVSEARAARRMSTTHQGRVDDVFLLFPEISLGR